MSTQQLPTSVFTAQSALGGLAYPFLSAHSDWQLITRPLDGDEAIAAICSAPTPTLRWVKDDKVLDLVIPGQETTAFLAQSGLELSLAKGGYVLSKRLSRIMRPFRYWGFFNQFDMALEYSDGLDARLWDGCGLISRSFVERLAGCYTRRPGADAYSGYGGNGDDIAPAGNKTKNPLILSVAFSKSFWRCHYYQRRSFQSAGTVCKVYCFFPV